MRKNQIFPLIVLLLVSCTKIPPGNTGTYPDGDGVFIVNEGNFLSGNGSLSFYSYDSAKVYNDLFSKVNLRPLGDVPNSVEFKGDFGYIVVNNSEKIEVVDAATLESVSTISGLNAPRNIAFASAKKAYVTSMYSDSIAIIDLELNKVKGYINIRRTSESIIVSGSKAFIASWIEGNEIMVIDINTDRVTDSITVGIEPESMVLDRSGSIWVLCNGGWTRQNYAKLVSVNPITLKINKELIFPSKLNSPSCLRISGDGSTIFYLDEEGVIKMNVDAAGLPSVAFIPAAPGINFYKLGINRVNGDVFVTDASDYQQNGSFLLYDNSGRLVSRNTAGIIPGAMYFRMKSNSN
jgi:YVTN family beta-propeller protein